MNKKKIALAITGPTGAGKSTLTEKLAKQLERCVNIDADHIKHMLAGGFYYDRAAPENPKSRGFSEWELVGESIGLLARNFQENDYDVIINGYLDKPAWLEIQKYLNFTYKVLLLPSFQAVVTRDKLRHADYGMGETTVAEHHAHFSGDNFFKDFIKIDSTDLSVEQTLDEIKKVLKV